MARNNATGAPEARRTILVVEDNELNREMLVDLLQDAFNVIEAEDGRAGLEQLSEHYRDIALVLLDVYMPVCDGFEFLQRKGEDERYYDIPVIVATASDSIEDEKRCLKLGANDFIVKPYDVEIMLNRINNTIRLRESASIANSLMWNDATDLYSAEFFYRYVEDVLAAFPNREYDIVCSDIVDFKSLNFRYGKQFCDQLLHDLADRIKNTLPGFVAGGRIGGDSFGFLIEHQDWDWTNSLVVAAENTTTAHMVVKFGIVENISRKLHASLTCDRAVIALEEIKDTYGVDVAWFNDELLHRQFMNQVIVEDMESALRDKHFSVYYQPKYNIVEERVEGAEALARWNHPKYGPISPDLFVPIFERNGLVAKLDMYICEEACLEIAHCQEEGLPLVPISINLSPLDFDIPDLAERIAGMADKHNVDHSLLRVEFTEAAYAENPSRVVETLQRIRDLGFMIELDDFGVGYSALASLNELPVDVIKLDCSLVQQASKHSDFRIVQAAIQLAKFLGLDAIAEGVETFEEITELKRLGCQLVQGAYCSKPLQREYFESYLVREAKK